MISGTELAGISRLLNCSEDAREQQPILWRKENAADVELGRANLRISRSTYHQTVFTDRHRMDG